MFQCVCCKPPDTYKALAPGTKAVVIQGELIGQSCTVVAGLAFRKFAEAIPGLVDIGFIGYHIEMKLTGVHTDIHWGYLAPVNEQDNDFSIEEEDDFNIEEATADHV